MTPRPIDRARLSRRLGGCVAVACALAACGVAAGCGDPPPEPTPSPTSPAPATLSPPLVGETIDEARATALVQVAREALDAKTPPAAPYAGESRLVVLTLARGAAGNALVVGTGATLEDAVRAAGGQAIGGGVDGVESGVVRLDVLETLSPPEEIPQKLVLGRELGLVGLRLPDADAWLLPDEIIAHGLLDANETAIDFDRVRAYLAASEKQKPPALRTVSRASFGSFLVRSDVVVRLDRGDPPRPVPTPATLADVVARAGDFLVRRQHPDGTFDETVFGSTGAVSKVRDATHQARACQALYELGDAIERQDLSEAADRCAAWLVANESSVREAAAPAALRALTARAKRKRAPDALTAAKRLAEIVVALPASSEGILGLHELGALDPSPKWRDAAERGITALAGSTTLAPERDADPWLVIALATMPDRPGSTARLELVTRIGDAIVDAPGAATSSDPAAGSAQGSRTRHVTTRIVALVALTSALESAGKPADKYRAALSKQLVPLAMARALTKENTLFLPSPAAVFGGIRKSPTSYDVPLDDVQQATVALLAYRALLEAKP
jgi:hypothetical protein